MNASWHTDNPMPARASREQRIAWHVEHARTCGCRPVPAGIRDEVTTRLSGTARSQ